MYHRQICSGFPFDARPREVFSVQQDNQMYWSKYGMQVKLSLEIPKLLQGQMEKDIQNIEENRECRLKTNSILERTQVKGQSKRKNFFNSKHSSGCMFLIRWAHYSNVNRS